VQPSYNTQKHNSYQQLLTYANNMNLKSNENKAMFMGLLRYPAGKRVGQGDNVPKHLQVTFS